MKQSSPAKLVLSPHDHIQALKRRPELQHCLAMWREIMRKEDPGLPLSADEERLKWAPRSTANVLAELHASRYGTTLTEL